MADDGEGVTLDELAEYTKRALVANKIAGARVEVAHFDDTQPVELLRAVRSR